MSDARLPGGELLRVAWKNVFRNRRRSALNIIALTVGMTIMILGLGWVQGYYTYIFAAVQDFTTGHAQVLPEGYLAEAPRLPVDITVGDYEATREALAEYRGVSGASGRVNFGLTLSSGRSSVRMQARGVDAAHEAAVSVLDEYIAEGEYLGEGAGILIGAPVAQKLDLSPGDTVFVSAMDKYSVRNLLDVPVVGVFDFGYPVMDENVVFMDLETTSELLSLEDEVTRVVLRFGDGGAARGGAAREGARWRASRRGSVWGPANHEELATYVNRELPGGDNLSVYSWQRFAQTTVESVRADVFSFYVMLAILYLLTVLGIVNSMSMSVRERTAEIGTLRAIGIRRRRITTLFLLESLSIAAIAVGLSLLLSLPVAAYLELVGVDVGTALPEDIPVPFGETFHADYRVWHILFAAGVGAGSAALGAIAPARRAARINIAEAMMGKR
ncbi:MAG: ABC transporter permease [Spirochaetota bacterium]